MFLKLEDHRGLAYWEGNFPYENFPRETAPENLSRTLVLWHTLSTVLFLHLLYKKIINYKKKTINKVRHKCY